MKNSFKPHVTAVAAALGMAFAGGASAQVAGTCVGTLCTITSTADTVTTGTLRDAIQTYVNRLPCTSFASGPYTIRFAFSGLATIAPGSTLGPIQCPTFIEGYDQSPTPANGATPNTLADIRSGTNANPRVIIDGATVSGPVLAFGAGATGSVVKGLVFQNFGTTALQVQATNVAILGNHFGTNESATGCVGAAVNGVGLQLIANGFVVGGNLPPDRNVFGCTTGTNAAIEVFSSQGSIHGNLIGTGATGVSLPSGVGIFMQTPTGANVAVGLPVIGYGNLIANNSGAGVAITGNGSGAYIQGNDIFLNGGLGIDLGTTGPNGDVGALSPSFSLPNGNMNAPRITFVRYGVANTIVDWSYNGFASVPMSIDFYANPPGNPLDEGAVWFGSDVGTTDGAGLVSGSLGFIGGQPNPTAAATTSFGTSEFSSPASLEVSPKFLNFTGIAGSTSAPQTVTFTNVSGGPIRIGPPSTVGDFAATGFGCDGTTNIPANGTCTVEVTYSPLFIGGSFDYLDVPTSGTGGGRGIELRGNALPNPILTPNPAGTIDLGSSLVGTASLTQAVVTFSNTGSGLLDILQVGIVNDATASFVILADTCTNATIGVAPAQIVEPRGKAIAEAGPPVPSCAVRVGMTPAAAGSLTAALQVTSNATNPTVNVLLTGTGIAPPNPVLAANPAGPIDFGTLLVGSPSSPVVITYSNSGTGSLTIAGSAVAGANAGSFQVTDNCSGQTLTATPPATCTIAVAMLPQAAGPLAATLTVTSNATNPSLPVSLVGTGATVPVQTPVLAVNPPGPIAFGDRRVGTSSSPVTLAITNAGTGPMTISSVTFLGGGFVKTGDSCSGATIDTTVTSCVVTVAFRPTVEGPASATLQILSNASNPQALVALAGNGTAIPVGVLAASPSALSFGAQPLGVASNPLGLQLTNTGTFPVRVGTVQAIGDFSQVNNCGLLDLGQSCSVAVTFTPTAQGLRTGELQVSSDAANRFVVVSLGGPGTAPPVLVPAVELSPGAVSFGTSLMGTGGSGTAITLRNSGGASLALGRIFATGDFRVSHSCPGSLPPGASCVLTVTFAPTIPGSRAGRLVVESDAPAGTKEASLSGTGCRSFSVGASRAGQPVCK